MKLNILAVILGIGFTVTGIFAFACPETFFGLLGKYYGAFNNHFVKDAGIAFFSSERARKVSMQSTPRTSHLESGESPPTRRDSHVRQTRTSSNSSNAASRPPRRIPRAPGSARIVNGTSSAGSTPILGRRPRNMATNARAISPVSRNATTLSGGTSPDITAKIGTRRAIQRG